MQMSAPTVGELLKNCDCSTSITALPPTLLLLLSYISLMIVVVLYPEILPTLFVCLSTLCCCVVVLIRFCFVVLCHVPLVLTFRGLVTALAPVAAAPPSSYIKNKNKFSLFPTAVVREFFRRFFESNIFEKNFLTSRFHWQRSYSLK